MEKYVCPKEVYVRGKGMERCNGTLSPRGEWGEAPKFYYCEDCHTDWLVGTILGLANLKNGKIQNKP